MKVLGIDPGLRNMAYCYMVDGEIRTLERVDIFDGRDIVVKDTFDRAMKFMDDLSHIYNEADVVLVEKQFADNKLALSTCLIVIQTVIQCICRTKCVVVHALAIKRVYGTSMGEYRLNKQAAIRKAIEICPDIMSLFPKKKIDDVSDAFLLAHFGTYHLGSDFLKVRYHSSRGLTMEEIKENTSPNPVTEPPTSSPPPPNANEVPLLRKPQCPQGQVHEKEPESQFEDVTPPSSTSDAS